MNLITRLDYQLSRLFLGLIALLVSLNLCAADVAPEDAISLIDASSNQEVIVSPIAQPAPVIQVLKPLNPLAKLRAKKEVVQPKAPSLPSVLLTRAERKQMALLLSNLNEKQQGKFKPKFFDHDDDDDNGYEDLILQQFYSRPRLKRDDNPDDDTANPDIFTENVKLRLMMARLKALEVHAMAHLADDGAPLSKHVQSRLAEARAKAVARYSELHSV